MNCIILPNHKALSFDSAESQACLVAAGGQYDNGVSLSTASEPHRPTGTLTRSVH